MSTGTNSERILQNNSILEQNNTKILAAIEKVEKLPDYQDIKENIITVKAAAEPILVSNTLKKSNMISLYRNYIFELDNSIVRCYSLSNREEVATINAEIDYNKYNCIDAGCFGLFGNNTIVVVVTTPTLIKFYLFDTVSKNITFKNSIPITTVDFKAPALCPGRKLLAYSTPQSSNKSATSSIICEINEDFTLTEKCKAHFITGSQSGIHICTTRWLNNYVIAQNGEGKDWSSSEWDKRENSYMSSPEAYGCITETYACTTISSIKACNQSLTYGIYNESGLKLYALNKQLSGNFTKGSFISNIEGSSAYFLTDDLFFTNTGLYKINEGVITREGDGYTPRDIMRNSPLISFNDSLIYYTISGTEVISDIYYRGASYANTINATISSGDVIFGKVAYGIGGGVIGTMPDNGEINITPSVEEQTIPLGYTKGGTVAAIDSSLEANLTPNNIRAGVSIFGVEGNVEPDKPDQEKEVTPTTEVQEVFADTGYELGKVTVKAVDANIDTNIIAENIKEGITILGITGTLKTSEDLEEVLNSQEELIQNQQTTINAQQEAIRQLNEMLEARALGFSQESVDTIEDILGENE